ncbi:MAG: prepilin-type N-terminal cleavage/methylation domain-containing protein [Methylomonas sp.]|jgi:MSHA pilin protein MshD
MRLETRQKQVGVTLIELVLSILIISIAMIGMFSVVDITNRHSADPLIMHQATAIAESYMDEILQQNYSGTVGGARANYNTVDNYNGLVNVGAQDQQGAAINGLSNYTVSVTVSAPMTLTGGVLAKQITVNVAGPASTTITLTGYRASY